MLSLGMPDTPPPAKESLHALASVAISDSVSYGGFMGV